MTIEELNSLSLQYQHLSNGCSTAFKALTKDNSTSALTFAKRFNELSTFLVKVQPKLNELGQWPQLLATLFPNLENNLKKLETVAEL